MAALGPSRLQHRLTRALLAVALAFPAADLAATVYKCTGPDRVPVYQDLPCPAEALLRDFDVDPPALSVLPVTPPSSEAIERRRGTRTNEPSRRATGQRATPSSRSRPAIPQGDASLRRFLHAGQTDGEVLARIGRPQATRGDRRSGTRWIYLPAPGDHETVTIVTLREGIVVDVERRIAK